MISSSACASSSPSSPSPIAATRSASRPRRSSSWTSERTACASPSATSAASGASLTAVSVMRVVPEDRVQLVLEAAGLDRAVDAALLRRVLLPPPAAGAVGLAGLDRACARRAADRRVALVVERVIRHVVLAHVVPDLVLRPLGERVELYDRAVVVIDLDLADVRPGRPLVAAQAGDPRVEAVEHLRQRPHLAHVAADQPVVDRLVEQVETLARDHPLDVDRIRLHEVEIEARVAVEELCDQVVRLLRQA